MLLPQGQIPKVNAFAQHIARRYKDIEGALNNICLRSCTNCNDLCCTRATVWYDLKDLLFIYLNTGAFPTQQIFRKPDGACCNLTPSGCKVVRSDRPFICTWYICATQKQIIEAGKSTGSNTDVQSIIKEIKRTRKELEAAFISATIS